MSLIIFISGTFILIYGIFFAPTEEEARQILNDYLTKVTTEKDGLYLEWLDWIAENVVVTVVVGVEKFTLFQVGFFDFIGGTVGFFHTGTVDHVFHAAAIEGGTFTGFAEFKFGDDPRRTVDLDFQSLFQVGSTEHFSFLH